MNRWNRCLSLGVGNRFTNRDVTDTGEADNIASSRTGNVDTIQSVKRIQLRHTRSLHIAVQFGHHNLIAYAHGTVKHAPDRNPSEIVVRVQISH